jgi:hypothetical protein
VSAARQPRRTTCGGRFVTGVDALDPPTAYDDLYCDHSVPLATWARSWRQRWRS